MQFRLTYEGSLYASSNGASRGDHKQEIRRRFHPQLKRLWETNLPFQHLQIGLAPENRFSTGEPRPFGLEDLANQGRMGNFRFVPLVKASFDLWCGLDVLFLRRGKSGSVFKTGDIDNRVKTILDSLKKPQDLQGIENASPVNGEDPFFCLFDDDSLVGKLSVETDDLLEFIGGGLPNDNDARIVITVTVRPAIATWGNMGFAAG